MNDMVRYATGEWFLVARERGLVLLPPTSPVGLLERVWQTLETGGLSHVIDALTEASGLSLSAIPPFAVAIKEEDDLRIAVRGGVRVAYDDGSRQDLITGGRVHTWVEQAIPPYSTLVVTPPDANVGERMLPVASGVVQTGFVMIGSAESLKNDLGDGRRLRRRSVSAADAVEDGAEVDSAEIAGEDHAEDEPRDADGGVEVAGQQVEAGAVLDADADADAESVTEAEGDANVEAEAAPDVDADADANDGVDTGSEREAEPVAESVAEAEAEAEAEAAVEAPAESAPGTEAQPEAEHTAEGEAGPDTHSDEDPETAIATIAEAEAEAAADNAHDDDLEGSADPEPDAELTDSQVDEEFAAITDRDFSRAEPFSDHDGLTIDHAQLPIHPGTETAALAEEVIALVEADVAEFAGRVVLSTGRVLTLERSLVIGRRPRAIRTSGNKVPALVTVESPTHDISRNHVEVRREGDMVLVTDLDTTNGTLLLRGQEVPRRLHPGEATLVISGDVIDIGDEVTITFEDLP